MACKTMHYSSIYNDFTFSVFKFTNHAQLFPSFTACNRVCTCRYSNSNCRLPIQDFVLMIRSSTHGAWLVCMVWDCETNYRQGYRGLCAVTGNFKHATVCTILYIIVQHSNILVLINDITRMLVHACGFSFAFTNFVCMCIYNLF